MVGTNEGGHKQQTNTVMAVSISELVPMLKSHNVAFTQATGECVDSATAVTRLQMKLLYAGFGLLVLLGAGGGVYLLRLKKQVKAGSNPPINSQLIRKIVGAQQAQAQAAGGVSGCLTLTALNGGRNIVLQANRAQTIGRSAQADIVIDKAQISARHVRLLFDGRRLEVEYLGSTNGTYANGSKITRTVLNAGDVLQLTADPAVARFSVGAASAGGAVSSGGAVLEPLSAGLPSIALQANRSISIGRSADNDVVINRQQISGCHRRISMDASGNVNVEDSQSTNGTYIDDLSTRITRATLRSGQTLYLANRDTAYKLTLR